MVRVVRMVNLRAPEATLMRARTCDSRSAAHSASAHYQPGQPSVTKREIDTQKNHRTCLPLKYVKVDKDQIQLNWPVKVVAGSPIKKMEAVDG